MTLLDLTRPGPSLEADGQIRIYNIKTGEVVAEYEGLEVHEKLQSASMWKNERQQLLGMTQLLDEHPEEYEGPCMCRYCQSCA